MMADKHTRWVAPMVNPDGHEYSRTEDRWWRKNRRPNPDGSFGVDPNRNYGYLWGTLDVSTSSHVPSDETYVGPHAFSEPETRAMRDLIAGERFRGVITYHSFSQLILYPWGYTAQPIVDLDDQDLMVTLAHQMQKLIYDVHDRTYAPPPGIQPIGRMAPIRSLPLLSNSAPRPSPKGDLFCHPTRFSRRGKRTNPPR
jgi:carboxypeptidase T